MAALPYIQLYVADYLADTMHLTTEEHGAYLLLIFNYWQTGKPIPKSRLARIARLPNERWISVEVSLNEFFNDNGNEWEHKRIEQDLDAVHSTQSQRSAAGKASAEARKQRKQTKSQRESNDRSNSVEGSYEQNPTNIDTDTDTEEPPPPAYTHDEFDSRTKFAMHASWLPNEKSFTAVLFANGMAGETFHQDQLLEFRSFWTASPDEHRTQAKWEHALAQNLKRDLRNAQAAGSTNHASQQHGTSQNTQGHTGGGAQDRNPRPARPGPLAAPDRVRAAIAERDAAQNLAGQALDQDG
ncbi:DUF1376 domain-containing protein [Pseudomonas caspiana]